MKYLKKFETEADKNAWLAGSEFVTPNVVLTGDVVGYNLIDPASIPLHIEAIEDLTISFGNTYEYSKDNSTWSSGTSSTSISANAGEKVYFRASGLTPSPSTGIGKFTISNGKCNVAGNVMSMAYGADFVGKTTIKSYQFVTLFHKAKKIKAASNLILPATTLANYCYDDMFYGCTSLVTAPELPATKLANNCYGHMFENCTNINYIKAMFTTTPSDSYTEKWLNNVSPSGTFVKNSAATWNVTGANGIPSGWTVETATE